MAIGKSMVSWFVYLLVISYFSAYVGAHASALSPVGAHSRRIIGITAFLGYGGALCQASICFSVPGRHDPLPGRQRRLRRGDGSHLRLSLH